MEMIMAMTTLIGEPVWSERTLRGPSLPRVWGVARLLIVPFHTSPVKHFFMWHLLLWSEFGSEFFFHFPDLKVFNFHCSILSLFHHHQFKFLLYVELKVLFGGCYTCHREWHTEIFLSSYMSLLLDNYPMILGESYILLGEGSKRNCGAVTSLPCIQAPCT